MTPANENYQPRIEVPRDLLVMSSLIHSASKSYDVPIAEITGPRRLQYLVNARAAIVVKARKMGLSLPQIGWHLGRRDHTTILHLERRGVK